MNAITTPHSLAVLLPGAWRDCLPAPKNPPHYTFPPKNNLGRDPGDNRPAELIIPKHQLDKLEYALKDHWAKFQTQLGGDPTDPNLDPVTAANIAANYERLLKWVDDRGGANSVAGNRHIEGAYPYPVPKHFEGHTSKNYIAFKNSELWQLVDFAEGGYSALTR